MSIRSDEKRRDFPQTSLTLFQRTQGNSPTDSAEALNDFFKSYWLPLYSFLRSSGENHEDASDYVQGFISKEMLDREQLKSWDPKKGSLRGFLKVCLDRYRKSQKRSETAARRGGRKWETHISMDFEWADSYFENNSSDGESPDKNFDREWAAAIVNQATAQLADLYLKKDKGEEFQLLLENLESRGEKQDSVNYGEIASHLGISEGAVKQRMRTFRAKFHRCLHQIVNNFSGEADVDDEIALLMNALGR